VPTSLDTSNSPSQVLSLYHPVNKVTGLQPGPVLGRLDRFDAIGPRAYRGPALMGDSRISNFF
jgi:hypothetical protein